MRVRNVFRGVFRWTRRILLVLLVVAAALYLFRDRLLARPLAHLVADQLSAALGGRFTLERVEGTYFTNLRLIGLRTVESPPEGALTRVEFDRAEAEFSIFRLHVDAVRIAGLDVELDLDRPGEPSEEPFDLGDLPAFPALDADGRFALRAGGRDFEIGRFTVAGDGRSFAIDAERIDLAGEARIERFGGILERESPDTLVWTSGEALALSRDDQFHHVASHGVRIVLDGEVAGHARLEYGGGEIIAGYADGKVELEATGVRIDERIRIDAMTAGLDPRAGAASVASLTATVENGRCRIRDAEIRFDHPFLVTRLGEFDVALPELEPYLGVSASVTAKAALADGVLRVETLELRRGASTVELRGSATLPSEPERWRTAKIDVELEGSLDARSLPPDPERPAIEGVVAVRGALQGSLTHPTGTLSVDGVDLLVAGQTIPRLEGEGRLDYPRLELQSLRFESAPGSVSLRGTADLEARTLENGAYEIDLRDLAALARMIPGAPPMTGSLRGSGELAVGERRSGSAELLGRDLSIDGVELAELVVRARLDGDAIDVTTLRAAAAEWSVELRGSASLESRRGELRFLKAEARGRTAELAVPTQLEWRDRALSFAGLDAKVLGGVLRGSGSVGESIRLDLAATGLRLLDGEVDATLAATGTLDAPLVTVTANAPRLVYRGHAAAVELRARQEADRIVLETLRVDGGTTLQVEASALWPLVFGREGARHTAIDPQLSLSAHAVFEELARELPAGVGFRQLDLTASVRGLDARADCRIRDLAWSNEASVVLAGETVVTVRGDRDGMVATLRTPDGSPIVSAGTLRSPVGIDWSDVRKLPERLLESTVEGTATMSLVDLSPLGNFEWSPIADLRGSAEVDVTLGGPLKAPVVSGSVTVDCPHLRLKADLPSLQDLRGRLLFDRDSVRIDSLDARLGYAPVSVKGKAGRDGVDLRIVGDNILLARTPYLRLRSNVDVTLKGPVEALELAGAIEVTDALYSEPIKLISQRGASADSSVQLFQLRSGPLATMKLDLTVRARDTIRLDNNMLQGRVSADLKIEGTGEVPIQVGRLDFRDLRFTFPVTRERLLIEQGSILFERSDPFQPVVRVRGEKRKMGYDLTVTVSGKPDDLEIYITSVPALPREEAILLLTTGALSENLAESGAMTAGMFAGRSILEKVFGPSDPDKENFMDRFEVDTGRDVSDQGDPTIEARFRISDKERWYALAERDRWGDYNGGVMLRFRFK